MSLLQEERSAETRRRLLDATVACLYERGYAGTTTTEIATRAGVSRGAQLHHFPKKDELVVSALEHVLALRLTELAHAVAEPPPGNRESRLLLLIDKMWPIFKGPTFYAWLELVVASRTDPALNEAVAAVSERFGQGFVQNFGEVLGWPPDREADLLELISVLFCHFESLAMERVLTATDDSDSPEFARALDTLKKLASHLLKSASLPETDINEEADKR
jgi:AcrR family transcriptional regulator